MSILLFDNASRHLLHPLTLTKAIADLRMGILTIKERWEIFMNQPVQIITSSYLQAFYPLTFEDENIWMDASVFPTENLLLKINQLQENEAIADEKGLIAGRSKLPVEDFHPSISLASFKTIQELNTVQRLEYPWQIFQWNDTMLRSDFALITHQKQSYPISTTNKFTNAQNIFIEEGASVEFSILNSNTGPIYIGKNATVMEGSMIRGPFALGENGVLKMGAKIYGATTLGPNCIGGGEIKNVVMMANSNKAHDGYLGDSVIGEWCNFGAGSTNSNVKNTAGDVRYKLSKEDKYISVGLKGGLIMGDYSRVAINTSINTGTIIGVGCNVFGSGLTPKFIPSFSWGMSKTTTYQLDKAILDVNNWQRMKHKELSYAEIEVMKYIFDNF